MKRFKYKGGWSWPWNHNAWSSRWGPWHQSSGGGPSGNATSHRASGSNHRGAGGPWSGSNSTQRSWHTTRQTATKFTRWDETVCMDYKTNLADLQYLKLPLKVPSVLYTKHITCPVGEPFRRTQPCCMSFLTYNRFKFPLALACWRFHPNSLLEAAIDL